MCQCSTPNIAGVICGFARAIPDGRAQQLANVCDAFSEERDVVEKLKSLAILALMISH